MITPLELPTLFKGDWENMVILTYGADIPFFEKVLMRSIPKRCKNIVILADGQRFLQANEDLVKNDLAAYLNRRYVLDGLFIPNAAHVKFILLTNQEKGRLLVGSGNLGMQGYASGGEIFSHYEYDNEHDENLSAFITVQEYLEKLVETGHLRPAAIKHIRHLFENTPWLYTSGKDADHPVRHNLEKSFLDQLAEVLHEEPVEELWIMSPFYDPGLRALKRLLDNFSPRLVKILVQRKTTSLDPQLLQKVIDGYKDGKIQVHAFHLLGDPTTYIHAKLYLVKTASREICLQGSPNLSQVAMLRAGDRANMEMANLFIGERDEFDGLLSTLDIQPEALDLDTLELAYQEPEATLTIDQETFYIQGGEWQQDDLVLFYSGKAPVGSDVALLIGDKQISLQGLTSYQEGEGRFRFRLGRDFFKSLSSYSIPVRLVWKASEDEDKTSNAVFLTDRQRLDELLSAENIQDSLEGVGDLELDDEELEALLTGLDRTLVIDEQSIWSMAKKAAPVYADEDEEGLRLAYADVDFNSLRHHPKLRAYFQRSGQGGSTQYTQTPLQTLLSSITGHFRQLSDLSLGKVESVELAELLSPENMAETEEEQEELERELERVQRRSSNRRRNIFKNFIRRYLRGIRSAKFQELADFDVFAKNYAIFSHLLWVLFSKEWMEDEKIFLIEAFLEIWRFYWGQPEKHGYFHRLDEQALVETFAFLRENQADARLLASIYQGARYAFQYDEIELRLALRDFWRYYLTLDSSQITDEVLLAVWTYVGNGATYQYCPTPEQIIQELKSLAAFETQISFLCSLEKQFGLPKNSTRFERENISRESTEQTVNMLCLIVGGQKALQDQQQAEEIFQAWQKYRNMDYYWMTSKDRKRVFLYDVETGKGLYFDKDSQKPAQEIAPISDAEQEPWEIQLERLEAVAQTATQCVRVPECLEQSITQRRI
jgi:hypothetical protein